MWKSNQSWQKWEKPFATIPFFSYVLDKVCTNSGRISRHTSTLNDCILECTLSTDALHFINLHVSYSFPHFSMLPHAVSADWMSQFSEETSIPNQSGWLYVSVMLCYVCMDTQCVDNRPDEVICRSQGSPKGDMPLLYIDTYELGTHFLSQNAESSLPDERPCPRASRGSPHFPLLMSLHNIWQPGVEDLCTRVPRAKPSNHKATGILIGAFFLPEHGSRHIWFKKKIPIPSTLPRAGQTAL